MASDFAGGGPVCHRQHLQLLTLHLPFHCQLPSRALTNLTRSNAPGHPQVPFHLFPCAFGLCQWPQPAVLLLWDGRGQRMQGNSLQHTEQRLLNVGFSVFFFFSWVPVVLCICSSCYDVYAVCSIGCLRLCSHYSGLCLAWFLSMWPTWNQSMNSLSLWAPPCLEHTMWSHW